MVRVVIFLRQPKTTKVLAPAPSPVPSLSLAVEPASSQDKSTYYDTTFHGARTTHDSRCHRRRRRRGASSAGVSRGWNKCTHRMWPAGRRALTLQPLKSNGAPPARAKPKPRKTKKSVEEPAATPDVARPAGPSAPSRVSTPPPSSASRCPPTARTTLVTTATSAIAHVSTPPPSSPPHRPSTAPTTPVTTDTAPAAPRSLAAPAIGKALAKSTRVVDPRPLASSKWQDPRFLKEQEKLKADPTVQRLMGYEKDAAPSSSSIRPSSSTNAQAVKGLDSVKADIDALTAQIASDAQGPEEFLKDVESDASDVEGDEGAPHGSDSDDSSYSTTDAAERKADDRQNRALGILPSYVPIVPVEEMDAEYDAEFEAEVMKEKKRKGGNAKGKGKAKEGEERKKAKATTSGLESDGRKAGASKPKAPSKDKAMATSGDDVELERSAAGPPMSKAKGKATSRGADGEELMDDEDDPQDQPPWDLTPGPLSKEELAQAHAARAAYHAAIEAVARRSGKKMSTVFKAVGDMAATTLQATSNQTSLG
ncbi:hypothetical protein B0H15DRAFT_951205 [Mycena belliarum]|uniref:Uncharacterized protein n=1 Tax=Mycena belliarum TaxID=1033014 RepID=A0AAD6U219_9AGAR|nr:hypothetical protein B0H15DRAFT_951205 [Mycena belliae]